jgi:hypothetical protein
MTERLFLVCRHFDFWPLSAASDRVINSMTPVVCSA